MAAVKGRKSPLKQKKRATGKNTKRIPDKPKPTKFDSDAVRIVPLYVPKIKTPSPPPPPPKPHLTYYNGPLLSAVQVFSIFWGPAWQGVQAPLVNQLNQFFQSILVSSLIDQLAEYSVPNYPIGHGTLVGTATITNPLGSSITDAAIQQTLQQLITQKTVPQPTKNSLYFFYMPPGVQVVMGGSASCTAFCGYHSQIGGSIFYAVMPFPDCSGCLGSLQTFTALTSTSSHELCESITDPIPGSGWYDYGLNKEIGDECAWMTKIVSGYTVQLEWSNKANSCI
jgi:hypothetical protein